MTPRKNTSTDLVIVKAQKLTSQWSKQKDDPWKGIDWLQEYTKYGPEECIFAYEESFIVGGIIDRIATSASSGFIYPDDVDDATKNVLEWLDLQFIFKNLYATGNCFLEKVRNNDGTIAELKPFLTNEVRIKRIDVPWEDGKTRKDIKYVQNTGTSSDRPEFDKKDVIHIKLSSMRSRYYGDSKIWRVLSQVLLLAFIEKYYTKLFERGAIKSMILADKSGKLTDEHKKTIKAAIEDYMKWLDNAFATMILPGDISVVTDLGRDLNDEAFLKYRDKLIEAISIGTNIPIDILLSSQSNRNSKTESLEELNRDIAIPLQNVFLHALKKQVDDTELKGVNDITLDSIDTKNQTEEMKTLTGYVDSGIMTPNEARTKLSLDAHDTWNELKVRGKNDTPPSDTNNNQDSTIAKIDESIKKIYSQYE